MMRRNRETMDRQADNRLAWLDVVRGVIILWIFLVHFVEWFIGTPYFANPGSGWPPLSERIAQLTPLPVQGIPGLLVNALRYLGWMGDQGVQIFVIASGFGLAYAALSRNEDVRPLSFYARRIGRILPLWWTAHLSLIALQVLYGGGGLDPADWRTVASFFGLRFLPDVLYYFSPAWWFIGLLLQLYLVFPFLYRLLRRTEPLRFFLIVGGAGLLIRGAGLFLFDGLLDWWSRGALFPARLPEFAFGLAFARLLLVRPETASRFTQGTRAILFWLGVYLLGNVLSFTLFGMTFAFLFTGAGAFLLIRAAVFGRQGPPLRILGWIGRRTYSLFLVHHSVIIRLVPPTLAVAAVGRVFTLLALSLAASIATALVLELVTARITDALNGWKRKVGRRGVLVRTAVAVGLIAVIAPSAELLVRTVAPQEVLGWGERPALEPHDAFGYRLKPDSVTRLRWLSYDYTVRANELGFPGPLYPERKPDGTVRILVTGDAFESAEGVDTDAAWPRLLEKELNDSGTRHEVLNFSITGWGPNQYESMIRRYAPVYRPDLILIGFFVNEYFDVRITHEAFRRSIGFGNPDPEGFASILRLDHFRSFFRMEVTDRLREAVGKGPYDSGYFLGNFNALERSNFELMRESSELILEKFLSIRRVARSIGAEVKVVMVPAPVQIAGPEALRYYPRSIDLDDAERFDLEQPQRLTRELCDRLGFTYIDLRPALASVDEGPVYQPRNMHWTESGHAAVAAYVAERLGEPARSAPETVAAYRLTESAPN